MSATAKQVRFHYGRLYKLRWKFQHALMAAHNAEVISYTDYDNDSPCKAFTECWDRVRRTTEKQLALAMREEIQNGKT